MCEILCGTVSSLTLLSRPNGLRYSVKLFSELWRIIFVGKASKVELCNLNILLKLQHRSVAL